MSRRTTRRLAWAWLAIGVAAAPLAYACGGDSNNHDIVENGDGSPTTDGTVDGAPDGTTDAAGEASRDAAGDASDATTHDGSPDGAKDAASDVAFEATVPPEDGGIDGSLPIPDSSLPPPDATDPTD